MVLDIIKEIRNPRGKAFPRRLEDPKLKQDLKERFKLIKKPEDWNARFEKSVAEYKLITLDCEFEWQNDPKATFIHFGTVDGYTYCFDGEKAPETIMKTLLDKDVTKLGSGPDDNDLPIIERWIAETKKMTIRPLFSWGDCQEYNSFHAGMAMLWPLASYLCFVRLAATLILYYMPVKPCPLYEVLSIKYTSVE